MQGGLCQSQASGAVGLGDILTPALLPWTSSLSGTVTLNEFESASAFA